MDNSKKHRIAILVKNLEQKNFNGELIQNLLDNKDVVLDTIIINPQQDNLHKIFNIFKKYSLKRIFEKTLFKIVAFFETLFSILLKKNLNFTNTDLRNLKAKRIYVKPEIDFFKNIFRYSSEDIKKIKERNLDLIIRLESGILKGEIIKSSRKGIISFHHGDNKFYRGLPPGFWEVYNNDPTTGFIIQKLNEKLDDGEIIFKGNIITKPYYILNQQFVYKQSIKYFNKILINYLKDDNFKFFIGETDKSKIFKEPNLKELFLYVRKTYFFIFKKILMRSLGYKEIWNICFKREKFKKENLKDYKIINNPQNRFFADPFVVSVQNTIYIFVEDYDLLKKKGQISCIQIMDNKEKFIGQVLNEDFHLSFPYIFKFKENFFMCPETKEKNEIRIYKCDRFPDQWSYFKTLIKNINAVDTVIFEKNNIWWMLTNTDKNNLEFSSELSIYYSINGPLTENWVTHKKNPIIVDANKARNAGLIFDGKNHFRLNQKIGFNNYGTGFEINIIDEINDRDYKETLCEIVSPKLLKGYKGTHHLSSIDTFSVIDVKKFSNKY